MANDANYEAFEKWAAKMASEEKQEVLDVYMKEQQFFRNILLSLIRRKSIVFISKYFLGKTCE